MGYEFEGKEYETLKELADAYGIERDRLWKRIWDGWDLERAVNQPVHKHVLEYDGKTYKSIAALARAYGVNRATLAGRLERGWSIEDSIKIPSWCGIKMRLRKKGDE